MTASSSPVFFKHCPLLQVNLVEASAGITTSARWLRTFRTSCQSYLTWMWSVKGLAQTFPPHQWCCFRNWNASTSWWSECGTLWLSCRGWDGSAAQQRRNNLSLFLRLDLIWSHSHVQALAGDVGMSSELDEVSRALYNGHIPAIWKKLAPDTLKSLGNWMSHFKRRYEQYSFWVRK